MITDLMAFVVTDTVDGQPIERMLTTHRGDRKGHPMIADSPERLEAVFRDEANARAAEIGMPLKVARFTRVIEPD